VAGAGCGEDGHPMSPQPSGFATGAFGIVSFDLIHRHDWPKVQAECRSGLDICSDLMELAFHLE